jgi:hypothetical protein
MRMVLIVALTPVLWGQTTLEMRPPPTTAAYPATRPRATVTFSAPNVTAAADGTARFDISITVTLPGSAPVTDKDRPAALGLKVTWPTTGVSNVAITLGSAAVAAGKNLTCSRLAPNLDDCIIVGGSAVIQNGPVLRVDVTVAQTTGFRLIEGVASNAAASGLNTVVPGTGPTVAYTPLSNIISFTCAPLDLWPGDTSTCTVTIATAAPVGGVTYAITRISGTDKVAPPSLTIAAGQTAGTFQVVAQ